MFQTVSALFGGPSRLVLASTTEHVSRKAGVAVVAVTPVAARSPGRRRKAR